MSTSKNFGEIIKQARKTKGYSQKELAALLNLDFTYLSKLENNRADYAPKEEVIKGLARELDLEQKSLIFLAGRIPTEEEDLLKQHHKDLPALFRKIRESPEFAERLFRQANQEEST